VKRLTHEEYEPEYEETIITQVGVKLIDFKDRLDFPLYLRMFDTPGNAVSHLKDEESVFKDLDFVFVVLDGSKVIHKEHVIAVNNYIIQRLRDFNTKVQKKEKESYEYHQYICKLIDEDPEDDGNFISPDELHERSAREGIRSMNNDALNVDEEEHQYNSNLDPNNSEANMAASQHTVMNLRNETYKSQNSPRPESNKDNASDLGNIYNKTSKKNIKTAMMPAVFHIITKKDLLSPEGLEDQTDRARVLSNEGVIDRYFFISSKDFTPESGIYEFLETLNDRRLDLLREEQEKKDSLRNKPGFKSSSKK